MPFDISPMSLYALAAFIIGIITRLPEKADLQNLMNTIKSALGAAFHYIDDKSTQFGVQVTKIVGSMWCAYVFAIMVLPGFAECHTFKDYVQYMSTTFLQLVLLSIIMVGQDVQSKASENRINETYNATMTQMEINQREISGIKAIQDELHKLIGEIHATSHKMASSLEEYMEDAPDEAGPDEPTPVSTSLPLATEHVTSILKPTNTITISEGVVTINGGLQGFVSTIDENA